MGNGSETHTAMLQHPTEFSWGVVVFFLLYIYISLFFSHNYLVAVCNPFSQVNGSQLNDLCNRQRKHTPLCCPFLFEVQVAIKHIRSFASGFYVPTRVPFFFSDCTEMLDNSAQSIKREKAALCIHQKIASVFK